MEAGAVPSRKNGRRSAARRRCFVVAAGLTATNLMESVMTKRRFSKICRRRRSSFHKTTQFIFNRNGAVLSSLLSSAARSRGSAPRIADGGTETSSSARFNGVCRSDQWRTRGAEPHRPAPRPYFSRRPGERPLTSAPGWLRLNGWSTHKFPTNKQETALSIDCW